MPVRANILEWLVLAALSTALCFKILVPIKQAVVGNMEKVSVTLERATR